ncbi:GNAT superfamily N-acetyltransferase [Croceifilum oryzae]|uniref:GNAT superfamily N-acetyltransferase n=1 Tax=Croceifilum oryzae TaxID=1553429 RepID=A0AAJ1WTZ5_9BACL|nr:GNAT family N-acetyltransferase [Croceifilum oryzae]MDQ0418528.1 GNAT superfamily N-acetyltransferase [Croceifilum oryzae]
MDITWKELTSEDQIFIQKAFEIYDQSFPDEVREPHDVFYRGLSSQTSSFPDSYTFLVGYQNESEICSLATAHYFSNINMGFIVYLATNPHIRSHGIGSMTLKKIEEILMDGAKRAGYHSLKGIVLETEKEEFAHTELEKQTCARRNRFFEKNQFVNLVNVTYLQPPLKQGDPSVPLHLFLKQGKEMILGSEIERLIEEIFQKKYQVMNQIPVKVLEECQKLMRVD